MANSTPKREEKVRKPRLVTLGRSFLGAISAIKKEQEKNGTLQQINHKIHNPELNTEKTSNEHGKHSTSDHERSHDKQIINSWQSVKEDEDIPYIKRMPRRPYHKDNHFDDYNRHSEHVNSTEKSELCDKQTTNYDSNFVKPSESFGDTSYKKYKPDENRSIPQVKPQHYSKSRQFSNFQKIQSYNNNKKTDFHPNQNDYSHRNGSSRNFSKHNYNDCNFQDRTIKQVSRLNHAPLVQEHMAEESFSDESHFEVINNAEGKNQRMFLELDETLENSAFKNMKITISVPSLNESHVSNLTLMPSISNEQTSHTSLTLTHSAPSTPVLSEMTNVSPIYSLIALQETATTIPVDNICGDESLIKDGIKVSLITDNGFIPPPADPLCTLDKLCSSAEKNVTSLKNNGIESAEDGSYTEEANFSLPDAVHLKAISTFILKVLKERSAINSVADKVVCDLNRLFKDHFEGNIIDYYGSYYTDLAITTSDINLTVQADVSIKKSFMHEIYKFLSEELERYHVYFEEGITAMESKINFTHPYAGVNCKLTYLGKYRENFFKMGKFLKEMCRKHQCVKSLIIVTKVWAEHFHINEVEEGDLHPIGFSLLVIHFLQHCESPVLPIYFYEKQFQDLESHPTDLCIGALWLSFLAYYALKFNWQEDVVTVTSADRVSKKSKLWENYLIAIEDPFTGKNIARSVVKKDVADYIIFCFKQTYNYFMNGPKNIPSAGNPENQSSTGVNDHQFEFSFNDCSIEQNEDDCERCTESEDDDDYDDCKKKIYVQPMAILPNMTDDFLKVVRTALLTVYDKYMLSNEEIDERKQFVKKLESYVRRIYPDAELNLFGSSTNGFGFKNSDLDINMTLKSNKDHNAFSILKDLRYLLRRDPNFINVMAIFSAQIPILKFRLKSQGWHGDISLKNTLAVHNSELLYTYSLIDKRCKILGCALKLLAKKALIAEVTEKALSSYSYLIMLIHFLQQTDPPVLPILQDNTLRNNYELGDIVENCNVWFCRNMEDLRRSFKDENETPVEQLFLDLLDFYCSFDCNQVITIRQKEILMMSTCDKMRTARLFNIQDPFLQDRNLGCVVSQTKAQETKNIFISARRLFRTPYTELPPDLENYFFSTMSLTGRYIKDILCDFCGKFGHDQNNCRHAAAQKRFMLNRFPGKPRNNFHQNFFKRKQTDKQQHFIKKI